VTQATLETPPTPPRQRNRAATAALVLGLLSLVLSVVAGIPAIVAAVVGLARSRPRGSGAVRSVVGLVLGLVSVALLAAAVHYLPLWLRDHSLTAAPPSASGTAAPSATASASPPASESPAPSTSAGASSSVPGLAQASGALAQAGLDPSSVHCGTPRTSLTKVTIDCTGSTVDGAPATIAASCPAADLLSGAATCTATVNGQPQRIRVRLVDGAPRITVL
jgi:hypothetical protein